MRLLDKTTAVHELARIAENNNKKFWVEVSEDVCFAGENDVNWVRIGEVSLFPSSNEESIRDALLLGSYEWTIPSKVECKKAVDKARPNFRKDDANRGKRIFDAFSESLQDALRRAHLFHPVFDVGAISHIPLRQPTTFVPDTSAVHQGALDFVAKFLHPWVRVKIPALVHMEILAQVDNYLSLRHMKADKESRKAAILRRHALSQGGQRALLRMEFTPGIESDRGDLGADPLRGIVTQSSDPEDRDLGLQQVVRSFGDRLIVETARRFQRDVRPDRPLYLLTSDQGMARMALSEGLRVFYFQARAMPAIFGQTVTGAPFHPFAPEVLSIPLPEVLWELAVSFGRLKVMGQLGEELQVWGIGGDPPGTSWQPYHCEQDLLWSLRSPLPAGTATAVSAEPRERHVPAQVRDTLEGWYKFSPKKMLQLMGAIVDQSTIQRTEGATLIGVNPDDTFKKYERFLRSGELVSVHDDVIDATDSLSQQWPAVAKGDIDALAAVLGEIPNFRILREYLTDKGWARPSEDLMPTSINARSNYLALGEAAGLWCSIGNDLIVATPSKSSEGFVEAALGTYQKITSARDSEWVLTGEWLEALAEKHQMHPVVTRRLLKEAQSAGTLKVFFEGSTPDTRFDQHRIWVLHGNNIPTIDLAYLYRGDFLVSGTASVRISMRGDEDAS